MELMKEQIIEIAKSIREKEFVVFCGAGTSKNSGLPLANELRQQILEKLSMAAEDKNEVTDSVFPFEAFIETLSENTDISKILDIFKDGIPNTNYTLIARLAKEGYLKTIFTTNFDLLIEKALEKEGLKRNSDFELYYDEKHFLKIDFADIDDDKTIRIFKIHGSVEDKNSIRTTLNVVASKILSDKRLNLIRYLFSAGKHKKVLILGYSCSDEFDITPQIQSIDKNQKEIVFIEHSNIEKIEDIKTSGHKNPFADFLGKRIKCDTDKLIEGLWGLLEGIIEEEYKISKSENGWGKHVDEWAEELEENKGYLKYFIGGLIFCRISNFKKAIEYYELALEIAKATGDKARESRCYTNLGSAHGDLFDFQEVIKYYNKALIVAKATGDKELESTCYTNLGNVYRGLGNFKKAIEYHEEALVVAKAMGDKIVESTLVESTCYTNLGNVYRGLGNFKKAIEYHEKALEIAKVMGNKIVESRTCANLGNVYAGLGNLQKAIEYHEKAVAVARAMGDKIVESRTYINLGVDCYGLGDFKKAIEYYKKALEIARAIGDRAGESACYLGLGVVYCDSEDFKKAIEYHDEALKISKTIGDRARESACYLGLGDIYFDLGDFRKAIEYYLKAEHIFREMNQFHFLNNLYKNLSIAYEQIRDYENAEKYKNPANVR